MPGPKGYLLLGSAFVLCPCHLPLVAALLAGTALGGFLTENLPLLAAAGAAYLVGALLVGSGLVGCGACPPCQTAATQRPDTAREREAVQA